jgi:hypothetical protein
MFDTLEINHLDGRGRNEHHGGSIRRLAGDWSWQRKTALLVFALMMTYMHSLPPWLLRVGAGILVAVLDRDDSGAACVQLRLALLAYLQLRHPQQKEAARKVRDWFRAPLRHRPGSGGCRRPSASGGARHHRQNRGLPRPRAHSQP